MEKEETIRGAPGMGACARCGQENGRDAAQQVIDDLTREQTDLVMQNDELIQYQRKLDLARKRYRDLFDFAPVGYFVFDQSGKVVESNHMAAELMEVDREQLAGKAFSDFIVQQHWPAFSAHLAAVFGSGTRQITELKIHKRSGDIFEGQLISVNFQDHDAGAVRCQSSVIDITHRKRFEQELERRILERTRELRYSEQRSKILSVKLMEAREIECKRIAKELHDSAGSALTAIQYAIERKLGEIGDVPCEAQTCLEDIMGMVNTTADEVRRISRNLHPSVLEDLGIHAAIRAFTRQFQSLYGEIDIEQSLDLSEDEDLPHQLQLLIYRIIQEALNNAAKHSGADRIHLSLFREGDAVVLTVADNGEGFDIRAVDAIEEESAGLGLASMRERTEHFGGRLEVHSSAGSGTRITARWVLPKR